MIVVGAGRIGTALTGFGARPVTRTEGRDALVEPPGELVLVAVRTDALEDGLMAIPPARRGDIVLVQNGIFHAELQRLGFEGVTRGALFVLVARRGDPGTVGRTSPFTGPRAGEVAAWLSAAGWPAEALPESAYRAVELEKVLWLAVNGVLGEVLGRTVGELAAAEEAAVRALVRELAPVGARSLGVEVDPEAVADGILAYSATIPSYRGSVKEWPWRNGWLRAEAATLGVSTPLHDAWLARLSPAR